MGTVPSVPEQIVIDKMAACANAFMTLYNLSPTVAVYVVAEDVFDILRTGAIPLRESYGIELLTIEFCSTPVTVDLSLPPGEVRLRLEVSA